MSDYRYEISGRKYYQKGVVFDPLEPHNTCPGRSPKEVSEAIKDIIDDKVVCDLGCAEGDNMVFMSRYAKRVVGIEQRRGGRVGNPGGKVAENRGLSVIYGDYLKDDLPEADVYYCWPNAGCIDNPLLIEKINQIGKTIIIGTDLCEKYNDDTSCLVALIKEHNGRVIGVNYNEGDWDRGHGVILLGVFNERE